MPWNRARALCAAVLLGAPATPACTIVMTESAEGVLVGNNEDYFVDVEPRMWITPGKSGEYGRVCFGFDQRKFSAFAQGGMNEAGLFFDVAVTPAGGEPQDTEKAKPPRNMGDRMLAECATVDEAVAWLGTYRLNLLKGGHMLLADCTGASAVVEVVDGLMKVVPKEGSYHAVTNFLLSHPERGNYPCPRYDVVQRVFKRNPEATANTVGEALQRTASPRTYLDDDRRYGGTLYSNIYNLNKLKVAVFVDADFKRPIIVDLQEYLGRGKARYALRDLVTTAERVAP